MTSDRELILEAGLAGFSPLHLDCNAWPDELASAKAADIRKQLAADPSPRATLFRQRFARLLAGEKVHADFKPIYRSVRNPRPTIRNLIYHVCPLAANELWKKNVAQLRKRLDVFNGRKVIAIATGKGCHPPAAVRSELPGCEFLELPNDRELREVATFLPLLISVADPDPRQATFYAHTKGNSTAGSVQGSVYWRNAMYHHLLDRWQECMEELETHSAVGTHKMIWPPGCRPYPSGLDHGNWMFAGTFYWFRNARVFNHPDWRQVPMDRYGAESWLAGLFDQAKAASVYQLWPEDAHPAPNPYEPSLYPDPIDDPK